MSSPTSMQVKSPASQTFAVCGVCVCVCVCVAPCCAAGPQLLNKYEVCDAYCTSILSNGFQWAPSPWQTSTQPQRSSTQIFVLGRGFSSQRNHFPGQSRGDLQRICFDSDVIRDIPLPTWDASSAASVLTASPFTTCPTPALGPYAQPRLARGNVLQAVQGPLPQTPREADPWSTSKVSRLRLRLCPTCPKLSRALLG